MSTHFTLDFSIAWLATDTLGLYPQLELRTHHTAKLQGNLQAVFSDGKLRLLQHHIVEYCVYIFMYCLC